jgi:ABC-type branched-subunit amino acid transport system ATPase component
MTGVAQDQETAALEALAVTVYFGGLTALDEVSLSVPVGQVVGLVGPNGAGKTTLFSVLSGLKRPDRGLVKVNGEDVTTTTPQHRALVGVARTFQHPELFGTMTVRDHLRLGYRMRGRDVRRGRANRRDEVAQVDQILELLHLEDVARKPALGLPLSTSRMVELGRAIVTGPSVILLDEPFAGLDLSERDVLAIALRTLRERGISLVLVEHDLEMVLHLSDLMYVLDFGVCIASGIPDDVRRNTAVQSAYLGEDTEDLGRYQVSESSTPASS